MAHHRPEIAFIDPRTTPPAPIRSRGELPHLYKENGSYFVTFRLWDAVTPSEQRRRWRQLNKLAEQSPELNHSFENAARPLLQKRKFARLVAEATEPPLRLGSCLLDRPECAKVVERALLHFNSQRYQLAAWCVMPNHVHVAYTALGLHAPDDIHHSWKSYTSHEINKLFSRTGALWERESFDHLIRSVDAFAAFIEYVEDNPVAAGLCSTPVEWKYSSAACFC